jgi:GT2 family glycosyltransferase
MSISFGVVVNYFYKETHPQSVKQAVKFALSLLKNCPEVKQIVLSDGSEKFDDDLYHFCNKLGARYIHSGKQMSFPDAYNYGVKYLSEEWIAVMASDIFVTPTTFTAFSNFISKNEHLNIGCLIPYLSKSDFAAQQYISNFFSCDCYASIMTFNLNVFKRDVYNRIGGMSNQYTGNYNDIDMVIKLKKLNLDVFLVGGAYAVHYGQLTLSHGSNTCVEKDFYAFTQNYPGLKDENGVFRLRIDKFLKSSILKVLYKIKYLICSVKLKRYYIQLILKLIPLLQMVKK